MNRLMKAGIVALLAGLILGCQTERVLEPRVTKELTNTTLCDVRDNFDLYAGRKLRFATEFKTDTSFYSFFVDSHCRSQKNSASIANTNESASNDPSVVALIDGALQLCKSRRVVTCPVTAFVEFEGIPVRDVEGNIAINVTKVYSYKYRPIDW
jgi:hypothetical protein